MAGVGQRIKAGSRHFVESDIRWWSPAPRRMRLLAHAIRVLTWLKVCQLREQRSHCATAVQRPR